MKENKVVPLSETYMYVGSVLDWDNNDNVFQTL